MRDEKAKLKELSNNISDRSEAKGTGIMSDLLLVDGDVSEANEPDTSGKSALYYIIEILISTSTKFGFFILKK